MTMRIAPRYLLGIGLALLGGVGAAFLPWQEGHAQPPTPEAAKPKPEDAAEWLGEAHGEIELIELELAATRDSLREVFQYIKGMELHEDPEADKESNRKSMENYAKKVERSREKYLALSRELGSRRFHAAELEAKFAGKRGGPSIPPESVNRRLDEVERRLDALSRGAGRPKD